MASFTLHGKEKQRKELFIKKHKKCRQPNNGPKLYSYIMTPNGIGVGISIRCPYCGKIEDITDVDTW